MSVIVSDPMVIVVASQIGVTGSNPIGTIFDTSIGVVNMV